MWTFRRVETIILAVVVLAALGSLGYGLVVKSAKWVTTSGLLFDVAGLVQLKISGLFERVLDEFGNDEKYPYGPPSHITRMIIANPDTPMRTAFRDLAIFDTRTGFYLLIVGVALQLAGTWL